jgi:hypothetical protein
LHPFSFSSNAHHGDHDPTLRTSTYYLFPRIFLLLLS